MGIVTFLWKKLFKIGLMEETKYANLLHLVWLINFKKTYATENMTLLFGGVDEKILQEWF